jgi:DNA-binding transcriptional ArsR family regulator
MYPARGAATGWEPICPRLVCRFPGPWPSGAASDREEAAEALLGAPRARLLGALRSPATTSSLARRFGVTPSAVSQHLTVLHRSGLVDRQRRGRTVLYQASQLGVARSPIRRVPPTGW